MRWYRKTSKSEGNRRKKPKACSSSRSPPSADSLMPNPAGPSGAEKWGPGAGAVLISQTLPLPNTSLCQHSSIPADTWVHGQRRVPQRHAVALREGLDTGELWEKRRSLPGTQLPPVLPEVCFWSLWEAGALCALLVFNPYAQHLCLQFKCLKKLIRAEASAI